MNTADYSKEIHQRFFDPKGRKPVQLTLKNDRMVEGYLVGFEKGNNASEPFVVKWHFIAPDELEKFKEEGTAEGLGRFINQSDISHVEFSE
ncbi:MAG: hypothetical protein IAF38_21980 [Bacteroidia bacterium]|nr:hypothetical protein [Bacteroidia bacterium]